MAFSLPVVKLISLHLSCPSATLPDDMILSSCMHVPLPKALHLSRFHQARPNDYPLELLKQKPPASFHNFKKIDSIKIYNQWSASGGHQLFFKKNHVHKNLNYYYYSSKNHELLAKTD
ncbi:beta-1,3-glucosyltransferase-like [Lucilia cuprina]|uniref:beta-1,3-glucosyltransferase-like n=1 Tax=Lucilia cuprina TaxID=7375 RepID=UPI001F06EF19|nr:beta-1,3-glucosyltransferase-like [Lucilia cuprina]